MGELRVKAGGLVALPNTKPTISRNAGRLSLHIHPPPLCCTPCRRLHTHRPARRRASPTHPCCAAPLCIWRPREWAFGPLIMHQLTPTRQCRAQACPLLLWLAPWPWCGRCAQASAPLLPGVCVVHTYLCAVHIYCPASCVPTGNQPCFTQTSSNRCQLAVVRSHQSSMHMPAHLLLPHCPAAAGAACRQAVLDSVDPLSALSGKVITGGRLNVSAAMAALQAYQAPPPAPPPPPREPHAPLLSCRSPGSCMQLMLARRPAQRRQSASKG